MDKESNQAMIDLICTGDTILEYYKYRTSLRVSTREHTVHQVFPDWVQITKYGRTIFKEDITCINGKYCYLNKVTLDDLKSSNVTPGEVRVHELTSSMFDSASLDELRELQKLHNSKQ